MKKVIYANEKGLIDLALKLCGGRGFKPDTEDNWYMYLNPITETIEADYTDTAIAGVTYFDSCTALLKAIETIGEDALKAVLFPTVGTIAEVQA